LKVAKEASALQDSLDQEERLENVVCQVFKEIQDLQDQRVPKVKSVRLDHQDLMVHPAQEDHVDLRVHQVHLELRVLLASPECPELKVSRD